MAKGDVLSDEEIQALERPASKGKVLSDAEIADLEAKEMDGPSQIRADIAKRSKSQEALAEGVSNVPQDLYNRRPRNASDARAMMEAGVVGPAQAVTFGHVPQIAGGINSAIKGTPYLQERDQAAKDISEIKARAPMTFGLSNFGTNLAMQAAVPSIKSVPKRALMGAAQGAAYNPGDKEGEFNPIQFDERLNQAIAGGLLMGATAVPSEIGRKGGDRLMQKAVGRTKYTPGVGEELANEGIWGTREQMKNQVNKKAGKIANKTSQLAKNYQGTISAQPIADEVRSLNRRVAIPSGRPNSSLDAPDIARREAYANEIDQRGLQSAEDVLKDRINAGGRVPQRNFADRTADENLLTEMSKAEQRGASQQLKKHIPEIGPLDKRYVPLAKAKKPLNQEENIGGFNQALNLGTFGATTPFGLSTMGQLGIKGAQAERALTPAMFRSLLEQLMSSPQYKDEGQQ